MSWMGMAVVVVGGLWVLCVGAVLAFRQALRKREQRDGAR